MIVLDNILVDYKIGKTHFECDLTQCKGACCTIEGEFGAPILDEEVPIMAKYLDIAKTYLSESTVQIIENNDFIQGTKGDYSTVVINNRDCVFIYYKDDIALCAYESAFYDGKIDFKKPVSCHLFPIRVGYFGGKYLYYEKMAVCNPALEKGKNSNKLVYESVKEALVRAFGEDWYNRYLDKLKEVK